MDWLDTLGNVNYWAVLAAVASTFVVGMVWYAEAVFGKTWMKLSGLSKKDVENKDSMMKAMFTSGIGSILTGLGLATLMLATGTDGWADGAVFGGVVGIAFMMASMLTHDSFAQRNMMLTKVNGLHDVVSTAVMGGVLGAIGVLG